MEDYDQYQIKASPMEVEKGAMKPGMRTREISSDTRIWVSTMWDLDDVADATEGQKNRVERDPVPWIALAQELHQHLGYNVYQLAAAHRALSKGDRVRVRFSAVNAKGQNVRLISVFSLF